MNRAGNSGFSLIEVLVSILVLAGGVIGAAGMQLTALRTSQQSAIHSTALRLAADMADRMRANDGRMRQADSENPFLDVDFDATEDELATPARLCYASACNDVELAAFEIHEWQRQIAAALPGGRAVICRDSSPWSDSAGSFDWACDSSAGSSGSLVIKLGWQGKNPDGSLIRDENNQFAPSVALVVEPYIR